MNNGNTRARNQDWWRWFLPSDPFTTRTVVSATLDQSSTIELRAQRMREHVGQQAERATQAFVFTRDDFARDWHDFSKAWDFAKNPDPGDGRERIFDLA